MIDCLNIQNIIWNALIFNFEKSEILGKGKRGNYSNRQNIEIPTLADLLSLFN